MLGLPSQERRQEVPSSRRHLRLESMENPVDGDQPQTHDPEDLLAKRVIQQDGEACELNQQGLKSNRFEQGVLVPQEYPLWDFHQWLRQRLGEQ